MPAHPQTESGLHQLPVDNPHRNDEELPAHSCAPPAQTCSSLVLDHASISNTPAHPPIESRLCQLPVEILNSITEELPIHSRVALSLACTLLLFKQGNLSWDALKQQTAEKQILLDLLARDHPRLLSCHTCFRLHNRDWVRMRPDLHSEGGHLEMFGTNKEEHFSFAYIQLAMQCHRTSPEYDFFAHSKHVQKVQNCIYPNAPRLRHGMQDRQRQVLIQKRALGKQLTCRKPSALGVF